MAASVTGLAGATINFAHTPDVGFFAGQARTILEKFNTQFRLSGTIADECDIISANQWTFSASTPQTKDMLADLIDPAGNAVAPARARLIAVKWLSKTDNVPLLIGDAVTNEWDGFISAGATLKVFPSSLINDGWFVLTAPNTTGIPIDSTHKALKFDPQTAAGDVIFILAGCSV